MLIVLCGVGYVGYVIVCVLVYLFCCVIWVDECDVMFLFLVEVFLNVVIEFIDMLEVVIDYVFGGSYFLVMMYNYVLDFVLCECIMCCMDFVYFGLIGFKIKCVCFEYCMVEYGVDLVCLLEMVCLIGVVGIVDKVLDIIVIFVVV